MPNLNKAYQWSIDTCNADNVGYSQTYRNQQTRNGITYYDCSSFIWYALASGGFDVLSAYRTALGYNYSGNAITTAYERAWLSALGFTEHPITGEWKTGDVLWRSGHTEMVYQGGSGRGVTMGAHTSNTTLAKQVSINTSESSSSSWTSLWRYGEGGASKYGASLYVICALCGNAWQESTLNPTLHELGGTGVGLFQWSLGRRQPFLDWLSDNGYSLSNGNAHIDYLMVEDFWVKKTAYSEFNNLTDFLTSNSTNLGRLVEAFMRCWEIPAEETANLQGRKDFARKCLTYLPQHAQDSSITHWITSSTYLSEQDRLNNAVMLYRYISSGGGGGGDPTKKKHGLPIWMMIRRF